MTSVVWQVAQDNGPAVNALIHAALKRGLLTAGEFILNKSNQRVPHEEGYLESTGTVSSADVGDLTVAISYDTVYAVIQHEDLTLNHDAGRSAKYLTIACKESAGTAGKILATAVQRAVGK